MSAAKLERLLNLTALLLETPRPLSAVEIRDRLGVYAAENDAFRRAFERDKDDLRAMGVPLEVQDVPGVVPAVEGYRIPKDRYYLRDPGLTAGGGGPPRGPRRSAVRRHRGSDPGAVHLPGCRAAGRSLPPGLPPGSLVPHGLRPHPRRRAGLPARPVRERGRAARRAPVRAALDRGPRRAVRALAAGRGRAS